MRAIVLGLSFLMACSSPGPYPRPTEPTPAAPACERPPAGEAMTKAQCECTGARVELSTGGAGSGTHCTDGETALGPVRFGIEGGWCCQPLE